MLERSHLLSLGVSDTQGPWVADVIFIHDENLNLHWISDPDTRHSRAILESGRVAGSVTQSVGRGAMNLGIQFEGTAERVDGFQFPLLVRHLVKRGHKAPAPEEAAMILDGDIWYRCVPTAMFLIDEEHFGFERQAVPLKP